MKLNLKTNRQTNKQPKTKQNNAFLLLFHQKATQRLTNINKPKTGLHLDT